MQFQKLVVLNLLNKAKRGIVEGKSETDHHLDRDLEAIASHLNAYL